MAIRIPHTFAQLLDYGPFGWTRVSQDTPVCEFDADSFNDIVPLLDTVVCSFPPLGISYYPWHGNTTTVPRIQ